MPSWLTGSGSALTGNDSALTATGVCAPLHPDFIKDGASFLTGNESVLTATTPVPCNEPPGFDRGGLFWYKADAGVTKNGSNQVSLWADQWPNHYDMSPQDSGGTIAGVGQWPVWTPNLQNGLPGLIWTPCYGCFNGTLMQHIFPNGTLNKPTADDAPVTILAVAAMTDLRGGVIMTFRMNVLDYEVGMRQNGLYQLPVSNNGDAPAGYSLTQNYVGQGAILMDWEYYGQAGVPKARVNVNAVARSFLAGSIESLVAYNGVSGFSIGYRNANLQYSWPGPIYEIIGYLGTDPATITEARAYLNEKWAVY